MSKSNAQWQLISDYLNPRIIRRLKEMLYAPMQITLLILFHRIPGITKPELS